MLHVISLITILLIILVINIQEISCTTVNPIIEIVAKLYQNHNVFQEFSFINIAFLTIILALLPRIIQLFLFFLDIMMVFSAAIGTLVMIIFGIGTCQCIAIKKKFLSLIK